MFQKEKRVPRSIFQTVLADGKGVRGILFSLRFKKNTKDTNRYSVVVPKAVSKSAVIRNKIRRQIYASLRNTEEVHKKPYTYVIYSRKGVEKLTFAEIDREMAILFNKING